MQHNKKDFQKLTRKPIRPKGVKTDDSASGPNRSSASCDLVLWLPDL